MNVGTALSVGIYIGLMAGLFFGYLITKSKYEEKELKERIKILEKRSLMIEKVLEEAK